MNCFGRQAVLVVFATLITAAEGLGDAGGAETCLTLTKTPTRLFAVQIAVNGSPTWLDVDTGSDGTVLDPSLKGILRLKSGARTKLFCFGGVVRARKTKATLVIPGYTAADFPCVLAPLNRISLHAKDDPARGILGADYLKQAGAVLDFGDCTIRIGARSPASERTAGEMLAVPFDYVPAVGVTVSVRINGRETVAVIDSGADQTHVYADVALPSKAGRILATDGTPCTILDELEFRNEKVGRVSFENLPVILLEKERPGVELYQPAGVPRAHIGLDVLCFNGARVDFREKVLFLCRASRTRTW